MVDRVIRSLNPYTGQLFKNYEYFSASQIEHVLQTSHAAFVRDKALSTEQRVERLLELARIVKERQVELAELVTFEMGKPIGSALGEVQKIADCCTYFAENASRLLAPTPIDVKGGKSYIRYEPLGPLFVISPFNFPAWLPFKTAVPQLLLGNTIILKHDEAMPRVSLLLEEITERAGFQGAFKSAFLTKEAVKGVINDRRVKGVSLTGSVAAGKAVGAISAAAMKKCVLELGGSDPCLVLKDADLDYTVESIVAGRILVSGQVCISPKRFIVDEAVVDPFLEKLVAKLNTVVIGNPADPTTQLGPMAREDLLVNIQRQITQSVAQGATLVRGGRVLPHNVFEPAIITNISRSMPVFREETFGPVFAVIPSRSEDEMIDLANDSEYGLSSMIFTQNTAHAEEALVPRLETGMTSINQCTASTFAIPFGGTKNSGIGKEMGEPGIREFANCKSVFVKS
mmetsp:Transcript_12800/g.23843  ORF Transcript_12800/g.23843 Transcript_12800/m.23843 type:complete len:457 (-) Transcript_12800:45-1415(-)